MPSPDPIAFTYHVLKLRAAWAELGHFDQDTLSDEYADAADHYFARVTATQEARKRARISGRAHARGDA